MSLIEFARATIGTPPARPIHLELTDGRQRWLRLLIFVVPGPAQDNRSRREGDICLVAAVNLTP
jgi:hypothetical protein